MKKKIEAKLSRFDGIKFDRTTIAYQDHLKKKFQELEAFVDVLQDGREKSLIYTHLEVAYMWAGKALKNEQIVANNKQEITD